MHFDVGPFVVIAGAAMAWLKQRSDAKARRNAQTAQADPDEQTRRVQEDIRRKIDQRRGAAAPTAFQREQEPPPVREAPPDFSELDAAAEKQKRIFAKMKELEAANAEADKRAAMLRAPSTLPGAPALESGGWLSELRNPLNARRAMVLREILGAPVALR
jgi:hypothetical protein